VTISKEISLKAVRENLMITRAELARRAGVSSITLDRIENGKPCRIDTKRKIVEALGFNPWLNTERRLHLLTNDRINAGTVDSTTAISNKEERKNHGVTFYIRDFLP
jgi:DNA-binding XRE family transcriptional regulator